MEDYPETMEDVFMDFKGRRAGLIDALTIDLDEVYRQCHPDRANLSLFGHPNGNWEVNLPDEEVPSNLPEPALGINFARPDGSPDRHWISLVACHSDAWLLSVAFYFAARCGFRKADRERLFDMINEIPSIHEAVIQFQSVKKPSDSNHSNEAKTNSEMQGSESQEKHTELASPEEDHEDIDEENEGNIVCRACGENYVPGDFWIFCDICLKWFHGRCVGMTPSKAERLRLYKCPLCPTSNTRAWA